MTNHSSQSQTRVLGPVQTQLSEAHAAYGGGQFSLQVHGPDVLQAAERQAVQQDEGGAQGGCVTSEKETESERVATCCLLWSLIQGE